MPSPAPRYSRCFPALLLKDRIVARPPFRRWMVVPFTVANQVCVGAVYAFSLLNDPLARQLGVVVPSANDWAISQIVVVFSIFFCLLGVSAAVGGPILEEVGPRATGVLAAFLWGGSWVIGSGTLKYHSLGLLYTQAFFGGLGLGLGYITPVSNLMRWYADRRGLAGALSIMGTGAGALIFSPLIQLFLASNFRAPVYLGPIAQVNVTLSPQGLQYAMYGSNLVEVVVATPRDVASSSKLLPGVYVLGTGNTGAEATFLYMGLIFCATQLVCAFGFRVPPEDWKPVGASNAVKGGKEVEPASTAPRSSLGDRTYCFALPTTPNESVHMNEALKTPQFYLLFVVILCNIMSGIGILAVAKTIVADVFETQMPLTVTDSVATGYVMAVSVANLMGRIVWASLSDWLGRKLTFGIFFSVGALFYFTLPLALYGVTDDNDKGPFIWYLMGTLINFSFYGGGFAVLPAIIADLFGVAHVGAIHGRILVAWSIAGIAGPLAVAELRDASVRSAIVQLSTVVNDTTFKSYFGDDKTSLPELIRTRVVTLGSLMQLAPPGTRDPSSMIYDAAFNFCGAMLVFGFFVNLCLRPPAQKHWMSSSTGGGVDQTEAMGEPDEHGFK